MEASIGRDRGQEPSNRECPDHIGAVGTYGISFIDKLLGRITKTEKQKF